jgi:hypothetical protein
LLGGVGFGLAAGVAALAYLLTRPVPDPAAVRWTTDESDGSGWLAKVDASEAVWVSPDTLRARLETGRDGGSELLVELDADPICTSGAKGFPVKVGTWSPVTLPETPGARELRYVLRSLTGKCSAVSKLAIKLDRAADTIASAKVGSVDVRQVVTAPVPVGKATPITVRVIDAMAPIGSCVTRRPEACAPKERTFAKAGVSEVTATHDLATPSEERFWLWVFDAAGHTTGFPFATKDVETTPTFSAKMEVVAAGASNPPRIPAEWTRDVSQVKVRWTAEAGAAPTAGLRWLVLEQAGSEAEALARPSCRVPDAGAPPVTPGGVTEWTFPSPALRARHPAGAFVLIVAAVNEAGECGKFMTMGPLKYDGLSKRLSVEPVSVPQPGVKLRVVSETSALIESGAPVTFRWQRGRRPPGRDCPASGVAPEVGLRQLEKGPFSLTLGPSDWGAQSSGPLWVCFRDAAGNRSARWTSVALP